MANNHWTFIGGATAVVLAAAYVFWGPSKPKKRKGFPGLFNLGNSCYLNVILQSWAACPSLLRWLGARCTSHLQASGSLTAAMLRVLKVLNNVSEEPVPDVHCPDEVLNVMDRKGWFISPGQQDCHELMQALSATLDEETTPGPKVLSLFDVTALQDTKGSHGSQVMAKTRISSHLPVLPRRQESPLHGLLASQLQCLSCGHQCPLKYDVFDCLTLTMPHCSFMSKLDLESLLGRYVSPEVIDSAHCANCSSKQAGIGDSNRSVLQRTLTIGKLPQCLCLHLQRLHITREGLAVKRQEHVSFPDTLCMDPFIYSQARSRAQRLCGGKQLHHHANAHRSSAPVNLLRALNYDACTSRNGLFLRPPSPLVLPPSLADVNHNGPASLPDVNHNGGDFFKAKGEAGAGQHRYQLTAVISHLGDVEAGHFVTYRRGPLQPSTEQEQRLADTWWFASDTCVERVSLAQVLASQAYMLFYEKV
ncbi:ubiquitin carboxyl-terminal hydrolase 30-like [Babylonia areolata]|uniref:ubiquitin carboxyl-terminal hydrolase 30-like n=1 Tax=Babylonia areolata TaxID=304850 RepID=UPI003FD547CE